MIYDAFSPILLMQLEALGFCGFGEAKDFVRDGNLAPGGALPCNTNGGLIGEGYIHGLNLVTEAVRQIRGTAANQLPAVDVALVSASRTGAILTRRMTIYYDPYDYEIDVDPHPVWRRMREEQPLYWNERYEFWALSRFEDVWAAYHDTTTFSSSHGVQLETLDAPIDHPSMIFMDPPEHDRLRQLVSRAFTPRRIRDLETSVTALVDSFLEPFVGAEQFDYVEQFGALVPPMVIGELLGVPEADRDQLRHWFDDLLHHDENSAGPSERVMAAAIATFEYVTAMIAERRRAPRDDLISALLEAELDDDGARAHARRSRGRVVRGAARGRRGGDRGAAAQLGRGRARPQSRPTGVARGGSDADRERDRGAPALRGAVAGERAVGDPPVRGARNRRSRRVEDPVAERQREPRPARVRRSPTAST